MRALALNCGSSSVKFALVDTKSGERLLAGVEEIGAGAHAAALDAVVKRLNGEAEIARGVDGIGHRVVHGGETFRESVLIDDRVVASIEAVSPMAPLHNPVNRQGILRLGEAFPGKPQVAVFDTAFHQTLPPHAYLYALPRALHREHGVRRYGFHGTSHRYLAQEAVRRFDLPEETSRVVTAHLGNGCSTAAVLGGRSIETSMGFSPLEGLVMGTRSGDIDPGLHAYLAQHLSLDIAGVTEMLNRESGLLGLSGLSGDMRELETAEAEGNADAALALEIFCYRLARQVAGLQVPLGGLDALVFGGGIGEHSPRVRARVLKWLAPLGFVLDEQANARHGEDENGRIGQGGPPFAGVVPTDEEFLIALDTARVLGD